MRFSARLAAKQGQPLIFDDAPRALRIGYIKRILARFVGTKTRFNSEPLDTSETHAAFIALVREESEPWDFDDSSAWAALTLHLKQCEWHEFYDFVELVGALLIKADDSIPFNSETDFKNYQAQVNALLLEDRIGWSLSDNSELHRAQPQALADAVKATDKRLTDKLAAARVHYKKAEKYLYQHPLDEANSIKEIISAVESVARGIYPKASTLGDAIKIMRKDARFSPLMLDALEKVNAYSNATPLVRHGHAEASGPSLHEAELAFLICVAFIRYFSEVSTT